MENTFLLAGHPVHCVFHTFRCAAMNAGRSSRREKGVWPYVHQARELWQNGRKSVQNFIPYERPFSL